MLKPDEKRCYVCGSQKHMAGECDRPKKEDPPPKGTPKGDKNDKGGKGKSSKGQDADSGKGKPQINKVEAETSAKDERELQKHDSNATEPENEPGKQLEEFQKTVVKMLKEKERFANPVEELGMMIESIKKTFDAKAKTIKVKRINKDEKRYGLLDSGATNNVRAVKKRESLAGCKPVEVEIAFDTEVLKSLVMNPEGTIIGPEGTETIVAVHEAVEVGYSFIWNTPDEVIMSRNGEVLPVEVHHGTPVLPDDICLKLIEEIEQKKREAKRQVMIEAQDEEIELQKIWPQLSTVLKRLIENNNEEFLKIHKLHTVYTK
jgi:hypothetical protein